MSVRIDASGAAQAITRAAYDNNRARPTSPPASESKPAAIAPERAADLTRQLENRLNTDIARIRQRVDTPDVASSPSKSAGRVLDIRA